MRSMGHAKKILVGAVLLVVVGLAWERCRLAWERSRLAWERSRDPWCGEELIAGFRQADRTMADLFCGKDPNADGCWSGSAQEFVPNIPKIECEGSSNPYHLAFRYYNAEKKILGQVHEGLIALQRGILAFFSWGRQRIVTLAKELQVGD